MIDFKDGERGRNRTFNLLIKSQVRLCHPCSSNSQSHNKLIAYTRLARTENHFQMLETLAMFSNVQPQLQPHLPRAFSLPRPIPHEVLLDREGLAIVSEPCPVATSYHFASPVEI